MSLGKIIFLSMMLGVVVGGLAAALAPGMNAALAGAGVAFASVIVAGLRQPLPKRRRRP